MKARVKATGKVVEVMYSTEMGVGTSNGVYLVQDLEEIESDYWTRLEHTYAGMVMQSILQTMPGVSDPDKYMKAAIDLSAKIATALVEKMKEERK